MQYVTTAERIGIRKGLEAGREAGREEGREEGRQETQRVLLEQLLRSRFGPLPGALAVRLSGAESAQLSTWFGRALTAPSLDAVFAPD